MAQISNYQMKYEGKPIDLWEEERKGRLGEAEEEFGEEFFR